MCVVWSKARNIELNDAIVGYGLIRSEEDQCVYHLVKEGSWILAFFFVDDGLICGTNKKTIEKFVDYLKTNARLNYVPSPQDDFWETQSAGTGIGGI